MDLESREGTAVPDYKPAMLALPIAELSKEITPESESYSLLGDISLGQGAWGTKLSNQQIVDTLVAHQKDSYSNISEDDLNEMIRKISTLKFEGGYYTPFHVNVYGDEFQTEYIPPLIADVLENSMLARGLDGVSRLYIGSYTLSDLAVDALLVELKSRGISIEELALGEPDVHHHKMVCQSATDIINTALQDRDLEGVPYAVITVDAVTGHVSDTNNPVTIATFGNNISAMVAKGGEVELVNGGITVVEHDREGVITAPSIRAGINESERIATPARYRVNGEDTNNYFIVTERGVTLLLPKSERLEMDGMKALRAFAGNSVIQEIVDTEFEYFENQELHKPKDKDGIGIGHQPSKGVLIFGIERRVMREALTRRGVDRKEARRISKDYYLFSDEMKEDTCKRYGIPYINYRWIMDRAWKNNGSSSTPLSALETQVKNGEVNIDDVCTAVGLGAGLSYSAAKWRIIGHI